MTDYRRGLGKVYDGFIVRQTCWKCKQFAPLYDLDFTRWCDGCVREAGGITAAYREGREDWEARAEERREEAKAYHVQNQARIDAKRAEATSHVDLSEHPVDW